MTQRENGQSDTIIPVRYRDISLAEAPFISYALHFSGPCRFACPRCHSRALWEVKDEDYVSVSRIAEDVERIRRYIQIEAISILGTDYEGKEDHLRSLRRALHGDLLYVIYTGFGIQEARRLYGDAHIFLCGTYRDGEWHENKAIYIRQRGGYARIAYEIYKRIDRRDIYEGEFL